MSDVNAEKIIQAVVNGFSTFKVEMQDDFRQLNQRLDDLEVRFDNRIDKVDIKLGDVEKRLAKRIDKLGKQLAYLEYDAPTREEFDKHILESSHSRGVN